VNANSPAGSQPGTRFEERLLAAILADFDNLTDPDALAPVHQLRPARSPFPAGRLVSAAAAAAVLVAAAAAGATALDGHSSHSTGVGGSVAPAHPRLLTTAYVVARVKAALNANTSVMITVSHEPDSQTGKPVIDKTWASHGNPISRSEILNRHGQPVTGDVVTVTAHKTVSVQINYRNRTWTTVTYPFGSAPSGPGPAGPAPLPQTPDQQTAQLRAAVAAGKITVVGRTTVDGQRAIELRSGSVRTGEELTWVSPASYLPIREIDTAPGQSPASPQSIREDYTWLPGTKANLRLLTAATAIPAGFTKVSPAQFGGTATRP
jgi:hypothetical protein